MSDSNHPQDQQSAQQPRSPAAEREAEDEFQRLREQLVAPEQDVPTAPSDLETETDVSLELTRETVRQVREGKGEVLFRRWCLIAVLAILGLVAAASTAVIAAAIHNGASSATAPALATLSGAGGLGVFAWRIYLGGMPPKPEPVPTGEGP